MTCYLRAIGLGLLLGTFSVNSGFADTWGRKIEKAVSLNAKNADIKIISEIDWVESLTD